MARVANAAKVGLLTLALFCTTNAMAQTVSSSVDGSIDGVLSSDAAGPSSSPVSSSLTFPEAFTLDFSDDGRGRAAQRPSGSGAVLADALFANGGAQNTVVSRASWVDSATNGTGGPVQYEFQYVITPARLRIGDFAGLEVTDSRTPVISYDIVIRANGAIVFESSATLFGGSVSHQLNESGTSLNPTFTGAGSTFGYDFAARVDTIDLGFVNPGESMTVEYEMTATVDTPGFEAGGLAQIGDPFDLDGSPGFTGTFLEDGTVATTDRSWGSVKSLFE